MLDNSTTTTFELNLSLKIKLNLMWIFSTYSFCNKNQSVLFLVFFLNVTATVNFFFIGCALLTCIKLSRRLMFARLFLVCT